MIFDTVTLENEVEFNLKEVIALKRTKELPDDPKFIDKNQHRTISNDEYCLNIGIQFDILLNIQSDKRTGQFREDENIDRCELGTVKLVISKLYKDSYQVVVEEFPTVIASELENVAELINLIPNISPDNY
ncbi:MAG: hypothetical protein EZS28_011629 [Streblomastix strix]|uniref:Uncharacterized protein n=1 Tax=Streblomastix strix TaxID=222440 RepID=A0A5J4WDS4_9EUKA|nr:MAG: hypothetical protein EZS28_011629 [Streblomastix strix]